MAVDAVLITLKHLWVALASLELPMALMGGLSVALWKHARATRDVDLLIDSREMNVDEILQVLDRASFHPKGKSPFMQIGEFRILQLLYEPPGTFLGIEADLLFADSEYQKIALSRRCPIRMEALGLDFFVLSCEDLIIHKLLAGRLLDKADAVALLRENRSMVDLAYLRNWVERHGLQSEWSETCREANLEP